jgi:hypothetical protein
LGILFSSILCTCPNQRNILKNFFFILKNFRDDTLYSALLFPVSRSTCFRRNPRPSSGAQLNCIHSIWCWHTHHLSTPNAVNTV